MSSMKTPLFYILIVLIAFGAMIACDGDDDNTESGDDDDTGDDDTGDDDTGDDDAGDDDTGDDDTGDDDTGDDDDDTFETVVNVGDLSVIRLKGDPYTRGYTMGEAMGGQVAYLYETYILQAQLGYSPEYIEIFRLVRDLACSVFRYTDEEIEQFEGIADGIREHWDPEVELADGTTLEMNENDLCLANVTADFAQIACSSVSAWGDASTDGEPMIARNLDWDPGPNNMMGPATVVVTETPEDESWEYVSVTFPGFLGCLSCMNGDGDAAFIHDTARWHNDLVLTPEPRTMLLRRALLAAQGATNNLEAFEAVIEAAYVDTGNNFHFLSGTEAGQQTAACFEVDDNETHPDGFATVRTVQDTEANGTDLSEAFVVTNNHRKRYAPGGCWRYELMVDSLESALNTEGRALTLDDLHGLMMDVEFDTLTVQTILFKPSEWALEVYRIGPDHLASEDEGAIVNGDLLFPWKQPGD